MAESSQNMSVGESSALISTPFKSWEGIEESERDNLQDFVRNIRALMEDHKKKREARRSTKDLDAKIDREVMGIVDLIRNINQRPRPTTAVTAPLPVPIRQKIRRLYALVQNGLVNPDWAKSDAFRDELRLRNQDLINSVDEEVPGTRGEQPLTTMFTAMDLIEEEGGEHGSGEEDEESEDEDEESEDENEDMETLSELLARAEAHAAGEHVTHDRERHMDEFSLLSDEAGDGEADDGEAGGGEDDDGEGGEDEDAMQV